MLFKLLWIFRLVNLRIKEFLFKVLIFGSRFDERDVLDDWDSFEGDVFVLFFGECFICNKLLCSIDNEGFCVIIFFDFDFDFEILVKFLRGKENVEFLDVELSKDLRVVLLVDVLFFCEILLRGESRGLFDKELEGLNEFFWEDNCDKFFNVREGLWRLLFGGFDSDDFFIWFERLLRGIERRDDDDNGNVCFDNEFCWEDNCDCEVFKVKGGLLVLFIISFEIDDIFNCFERLFRGIDNRDDDEDVIGWVDKGFCWGDNCNRLFKVRGSLLLFVFCDFDKDGSFFRLERWLRGIERDVIDCIDNDFFERDKLFRGVVNRMFCVGIFDLLLIFVWCDWVIVVDDNEVGSDIVWGGLDIDIDILFILNDLIDFVFEFEDKDVAMVGLRKILLFDDELLVDDFWVKVFKDNVVGEMFDKFIELELFVNKVVFLVVLRFFFLFVDNCFVIVFLYSLFCLLIWICFFDWVWNNL